MEMRCEDAVIVISPSCLYFTFHISFHLFLGFSFTLMGLMNPAAFIMMAHREQIKNLNLKRESLLKKTVKIHHHIFSPMFLDEMLSVTSQCHLLLFLN